jgi:RHS repeat-associated protein
MTTSTGAVAERYAYTAYGQPTILNASGTVLTTSAVGNRYTYTGREWDETLGLYHFRARWMSPLAGRFLGSDPIGYEGSPWNLYELEVFLSYVDPSGFSRTYPLPDVICTTELLSSQHVAECTIPWLGISTTTDRIPCPSEDYESCCKAKHGQSLINFEGSIEFEFEETCNHWEPEYVYAGLPIGPILRACGLISKPVTRTVRGIVQVLRTAVTRSRHISRRTGSAAKTVMKRCEDWCKKFESNLHEPEKGGTPTQRNDCRSLCRNGAGLPCAGLKLLCLSMPPGEKQNMCLDFHKFTCLKP